MALLSELQPAIAVAVAFLTAGCANDFSHGAGFPISSERAVQIASDELRRRGIAISPRWRVDVTDDVVITEAVGDIPTWLVTFHAPGGKFGFPRYRVSVYRYGGGVYDFLDSATFSR